MATQLVSPGVSVTVIDESFFIPAQAPTVPLIFLATADEKLRPDGITPAAGTYEHNVVRTITSVTQSTDLYGIPRFIQDSSGNQHHGDARNEYGLFALNQFLGIAARAYVIRANVNLNDEFSDIQASWDRKIQEASFVLENNVNAFINEFNVTNGFVPSNPNYKQTVTRSEFLSLAREALTTVWDCYSFQNSEFDYFDDNLDPLLATAGYQVVDINDLVERAYQVMSFASPVTVADATGLMNDTTTYTVDVSIDGAPSFSVSFFGQNAQTYGDMVNEMNTDLAAAGVASIDTAGRLRITSATTGAGASVVMTGGGTLQTALTGVLGPSITGNSGDQETMLANDATVYTAVVNVDGLNQNVQITGSTAQTYTDLLTQLAFDVALASWTFDGGNIRCESLTTGLTSTINITDGTLFAALYEFQGFATPVPGVAGDSPLDVYADGFDLPPTGTYEGLEGDANTWVTLGSGSVVATEWTADEAAASVIAAADDFKFTVEFRNQTSLGANDAARRVAIVTALQASINSNQEVRSENFEYNLILCPGYHETVDEMLALSQDICEEAFVIADTPFDLTPSEVVSWGDSSARLRSTNVAYYYPHALASNLDGVNVMVAASGVALRTYAFNDETAELWFAPAGTRRGQIIGITQLGIFTGTAGTPTEFVETNVNLGQRDDLYKYFTNMNPLVFFPGRGFLVWGQKTSAPNASALDRVNVVRLVMYIRRQLRKNSLSFVFQPNDQLTRDAWKAAADGFLGDLVIKRGLFDFATISDESNNPPDKIDRNEMCLDIAIKPVKAAEFLCIPITVVTTGADIS